MYFIEPHIDQCFFGKRVLDKVTKALHVKSGFAMLFTYSEGAEFRQIGYRADFLFLWHWWLIWQPKSKNIGINLRTKL